MSIYTTTCKVVTWNLWLEEYAKRHGVPTGQNSLSPNWADRFPKASQAIEQMKPDILCLQEIDKKMASDIGRLLETAGYRYAMTLVAQHGGGRLDGVAVLYNQDRFTKISEKRLKATINRFGTAQIDLLDRTTQQVIRVASIHLQFQGQGYAQLQEVLASFGKDPAPLQILAGDFNREIHQVESAMQGFSKDDVQEATSMNQGGRESKIDHIFVQQTRPESCRVESLRCGIHQESKLQASDHAALIMDITYSYTPVASDQFDSVDLGPVSSPQAKTSSSKPEVVISCWTTFFSFFQWVASVFLSLIRCGSNRDGSIAPEKQISSSS